MHIVYDAGALIAAARRDPKMLLVHRRALAEGAVPLVPTIVLGQVWRGTPRNAMMATVLQRCRMHVLDVITATQGDSSAVSPVPRIWPTQWSPCSRCATLRRLTAAAGRKVEIFAV